MRLWSIMASFCWYAAILAATGYILWVVVSDQAR